MYVYYTVDAEFWPQNPYAPDFAGAEEDYHRDVLGMTRQGEFGIRYQMDALEAERLKGVFFLEALHPLKLGHGFLRDMVQLVEARGHEAALHIHPEWLGWADEHPLGGRTGSLMKKFSAADQQWMIRTGLRFMWECGSSRVVSFRAGNYGADRNTLSALAGEGVSYDSSYNIAYLENECGIHVEGPLTRPREIDGVIEVPISFLQTFLEHARPMQIMAASFEEMRMALENAERRGFPSFVLVSHGFELIHMNIEQRGKAQVDGIVRGRFDKLMKYLGKNKDRYQVTTFAETVPQRLFGHVPDERPIKGSVFRTSGRMFEQFLRRALEVAQCQPFR